MSTRQYNEEFTDSTERLYTYGFDLDVMHPFMLRSFEPMFRPGSVLELGSFKGNFTKRLLEKFDDVTCVEASDEAIAEAEAVLGTSVKFINGTFETVELPRRHDNIVLTHVLEHLDDPVMVLRRINEEWLAPGGRLFLVCPNGNAPSRQIAVKMGLISHNTAVTPAEALHGHRITYALDTLERDVVASGLRVAHRSGIFFKAPSDRHHLEGVPGGLLRAGPAVPGPLLEHLPDVRARWIGRGQCLMARSSSRSRTSRR